MKKKFLIIGSNSFTGSHFVDFCLKKSHKITGISRSSEFHDFYLENKKNQKLKKNFVFFKLDLNRDLKKIIKLIKTTKPSHIVIQLLKVWSQSWISPVDWYQTNVISSIKLIENIKV